MKKLLLILLSTVALISCKEDSPDTTNIGEVVFNISYDTDGYSPSGEVYIYYVENVSLESIEPNFSSMFLKGSNGYIVSYLKKFRFSKDTENKASLTVKWSELPNLEPYGFPKEGKYVFAIKLDDEFSAAKRITSKIFNVQGSMVVNKKFIRDGDYGSYKYEEWQ